jgi:hypothetical protein
VEADTEAKVGEMLPLEGTLVEKLRKLEALHAGTKIDGEREAARHTRRPWTKITACNKL